MTIDSTCALTKQSHRAGTPPNMGDVLVIDDMAIIRHFVVEFLESEGYAVRSASDAESGRMLIMAAPPALLLLDLRLPDMPGDELLRRLRAAGYIFPIVLLTGTPQSAEWVATHGGTECIAKPFDLETLLACVARYVQPTDSVERHLGASR